MFNDSRFDGGEAYSELHAWRALHMGSVGALGNDSAWGRILRRYHGTWNASAVRQLQDGDRRLVLRLSYLSIELESDDHRIDIALHGPEIGYGFKF